jgi:3-oxoacyl-[acyl-carrier-protein] synthase II
MKRVVITGMAGLTPIGQDWKTIEANLKALKSGIQRMEQWERFTNLNTRLGAPIVDFIVPAHYNRKQTRSMGRVALLAVRSAELALQDAGLLDSEEIQNGNVGVAYGSSAGSSESIGVFGRMLNTGAMQGLSATTYIKMMSHTCAVNIGLFFGLKGRIIPTSTACTSGSQAIGYAYETIQHGYQTIMIAGGAEELCPTQAAVFDTLFATSSMNHAPQLTPRPFDKDRDGLVIGEGACSLILEELQHAKARGARIYAEIVGFATNSDGAHVTQPTVETMRLAIQGALTNARLTNSEIGYVNAHGTATEHGDIAESQATRSIFGPHIPISSLKSYIGHTLGACGAIESWITILMTLNNWFAPTINLANLDPRCAELDYIINDGRTLTIEYAMNNNFAFGGINTSLIFKRYIQ